MTSELRLHTVLAHELARNSLTNPEPYRCVVGMDINDETVWIPNYGHDLSEATQEVLELPGRMATRATIFFEHWLAAPSRFKPYNCHTFADFMAEKAQSVRGYYSTNVHHVAARAVIAAGTEAQHPLELGEHGVIGAIQSDRRFKKEQAYHSVIGLGLDNPECLQVTRFRGFMGLSSYDSLLSYYCRPYENKGGVQLYAVQQET
jgi:hypothetical protein